MQATEANHKHSAARVGLIEDNNNNNNNLFHQVQQTTKKEADFVISSSNTKPIHLTSFFLTLTTTNDETHSKSTKHTMIT
jgi:hypothetical protein